MDDLNIVQLNEKIATLDARFAGLEGRIEDVIRDAVEDAVSDAVEDAVSDAVEDAVEDAVSDAVQSAAENAVMEGKNKMYILSQDKKLLTPFISFEACRIKKDDERYALNVRTSYSVQRVGTYENKEAALREMSNIADALRDREILYKIK